MKNKDGYIYVNLLVLVTIITLLILSFMGDVINRKNLTKAKLNQIQAFNSSESKILQVIQEDKYRNNKILPYVLKTLKNKSYNKFKLELELELDNGDLINQDNIKLIRAEFDKNLNRNSKPNQFYIKVDSKVNNSNSNLIGDIVITNNIFTYGKPIIKPSDDILVNKDIQTFFNDFMEEDVMLFQPTEKFTSVIDIDAEIFEIYIDENKDFYLLKDGIKYTYLNEEFLRLFAINKKGTNVYIEKYKEIDNIIKLAGILYVNGDLIINNNLNFQGIIVVNNGKIRVGDDVYFENDGLLISNNKDLIETSSNVKLKYNHDIIFEMGPYIPGYIDFKIKNIRGE